MLEDFCKGDSKRWLLTLTDPTTGDPLDLTGATVIFTLKLATGDADDAAGALNLFITDHTAPGVAGQTYLDLDAASSAALVADRRYYYWIKAVLADGTVATADRGRVQVLVPGTTLTAAPSA